MEEAAVSMPLIGTALGGDRDLSAGGFSKLRLVIRGKNLHLLDRVGIDGDVGSTVVAGVDVGSAVDGEFVLIGARAVDIERVNAAGPGNLAVEVAHDSGDDTHEIEDVPAVESKVIELVAGDEV